MPGSRIVDVLVRMVVLAMLSFAHYGTVLAMDGFAGCPAQQFQALIMSVLSVTSY